MRAVLQNQGTRDPLYCTNTDLDWQAVCPEYVENCTLIIMQIRIILTNLA